MGRAVASTNPFWHYVHLHSLEFSAELRLLPGFSDSSVGEEFARQCRSHRRCRFDPWVRKIPYRRKWQPTPVFLSGQCQGQKSLVGSSPWGPKESDTPGQLNTAPVCHRARPCPRLPCPLGVDLDSLFSICLHLSQSTLNIDQGPPSHHFNQISLTALLGILVTKDSYRF